MEIARSDVSARDEVWRNVETSDSAVAEFDGWLKELMQGQGSDLHVKVGSPPMIRLPSGLQRMPRDPITPVETVGDRGEHHPSGSEGDLRRHGRGRLRLFPA